MSSSEFEPYRISIVGLGRQDIRQIADHFDSIGCRDVFRGAWLTILSRLIRDPYQFGESRYRLLKGEVVCCIGAVKPIAIHFGIHEKTRNVMIARAFLLGSS
jgi:hypothetical protein